MKILSILLVLSLITTPCLATIDATCAWELRASATGGNVNGGGYVTGGGGTDFSLQDAAEDSNTDLVVANGNFDRVYSAAADFDQAKWVGNVIHITDTGAGAQFLVGWYEIIGHGDDADDYFDLDRNCATGNDTNGDWYIGGAMSLASAWDDAFFEQITPGNTIWMEVGTYTTAQNVTVVKDGTLTAPILISGYKDSRG